MPSACSRSHFDAGPPAGKNRRIGLWGGNAFRNGASDKEISTKLMTLPKRLFADPPTRRSGAPAGR
jgi:hypothetical protein